MPDQGLVKFAQWAPDVTPINTNVNSIVQNVIPRADGYGPFASLVTFTQALPGPCRGVFFARDANENIVVFAGTSTALYQLTSPDNINFSWLNVGTYAALDANDIWQFAQFNLLVIAVQINVQPQVFTLGSSTSFSNLGAGGGGGGGTTGAIATLTITGGTTGWADGLYPQTPLINALPTPGAGTFATADITVSGGSVTVVTVNSGGFNYTVGNTLGAGGFSPGSSTGLALTVASVTSGSGGGGGGTSALPPKAGHVAVVNQFIVLSDVADQPQRIQWCDLDNPTQWTPGVGLADFQDMQDGGFVFDIRGGDNYGVIFQDDAIRTLVFAPGSPLTFQIQRIAQEDGLLGPYSAVQAGPSIFYYSYQGFKSIQTGGLPTPIGKERVDRFFLSDVDQNNFQLFVAATDPSTTRVYWTYKSKANATLTADKIICYDWALDQWSLVFGQTLQYLTRLSVLGFPGKVPISSILREIPEQWFLGGFSNNNQLGIFSGPALEAVIETPMADMGDRVFIQSLRPMTDAEAAFGSLGVLDTTNGDLNYSREQALDSFGRCPQRVDTRYARARVRIPAGTTWTYAMGVRPEALTSQGDR